MFEFFIAKKYLRTKNRISFISIISILSTLGITIGVAALVIVISVFNGFGDLAIKMLVDASPHIRIVAKSDINRDEINKTISLLQNDNSISNFTPYLQGKVVVAKNNSYEIVDIKGVSEFNLSGISNRLIGGELNLNKNSDIPQIAIGLSTAYKLSVRIGDTLTTMSFNSIEKMLTNFLVVPNRMRVIISGIYKGSGKAKGNSPIYINLLSAKRILRQQSITGFEIRLNSIDNSEIVKKKLLNELPPNKYSIYTWYDLNKDFYTVLKIERWGAFILLLLIISVATFNILGSLTMSVIQKKKDIGVMRAMGVSKKSIQKIFMFEGILVGLVGTFSGMLLGLLICYLQIEFKLYPLDPMKYIIDAIPIQLRLSDLIIIPIASMLLSFLASLYPARRAVNMNIIETIKYE